MKNDNRNLTLLTDFYELTMANGYFENGMGDIISYFDMFFRNVPDGGGFAIMCGLEQLIEYMEDLHFDDEDIEFLRSKGIFSEEFLNYLRNFRFSCDVWERLYSPENPLLQSAVLQFRRSFWKQWC